MGTLCFNVIARLALMLALTAAADVTHALGQSETTRSTAAADSPFASSRWPSVDAGGPQGWGPVQLVIFKSKRSLALYRAGNFEREVRIVLGLQPSGRKRHANDARTPEGLYHVTSKLPHQRWQVFLELDYPNEKDRHRYEEDVRAGRIPDEDGRPFAIGDSIGIHGNDRPAEQEAGVDWTKGCIALKAADIAAVAAIVPVGTPVWIVE